MPHHKHVTVLEADLEADFGRLFDAFKARIAKMRSFVSEMDIV